MKIRRDDITTIWMGAYAVAMHAVVASGVNKTAKEIDRKAKELADIATETIVEKAKQIEEDSR